MEPGRRIRIALAVSFVGLLFLMVYSGVEGLRTLRRLHAEESEVRRAFLARSEPVAVLRVSVRDYSNRFERYLRSDDPQSDPQARNDLAKLAADVTAAVNEYPSNRLPEEQARMQSLQKVLADHRQVIDKALAWSRDEQRQRASAYIREQVTPSRLRVADATEEVSIYVAQGFADASSKLQMRYDSLHSRMYTLLLVTLGAGLLLSLASALYIFRLERQTNARYEEIVQNRLALRDLSGKLVDAQESERRSISRELHDEVGQALGAALVELGRVSSLLPASETQIRDLLTHVKGVLESTVQSVRNIALLLRPSMLDDLGLLAALEWQGREISRNSEMEVSVEAEGLPEKLPDEYNTCIYRLVQEALNNASRHSGAKLAHVTVRRDGGRLLVSIKDNGSGFDPTTTAGMGVLGMRERAERLGGSLSIDSQRGTGTTVRAELPLPPAEGAQS
jgi:signal transduction histidine kinase